MTFQWRNTGSSIKDSETKYEDIIPKYISFFGHFTEPNQPS